MDSFFSFFVSLPSLILKSIMNRQSPIDIFQYDDYRKFLRGWYLAQKRSRRSFSFRAFSERAGFHSTNFFKLVMDGDRNLTEESLAKFVIGLDLNKQEQDFFRNLVFFNQAKTHEEKDLYYHRLIQSHKFGQLKPIEKRQYDYYSNWYHSVVRELVASREFDGTPEWIAQRVFPPIAPAQVQKTIELLDQLGFIEKVGDRWRQADTILTTGPEVKSHVIMNYHRNILELSREILDKVPQEERDISTMTLGVSKDRISELKKRVREFRKEILKLVSEEVSPEEVVQLNIQLFPLTRAPQAPREG